MAKLTIADLGRIKEETTRNMVLREGAATVQVTVHMGTCGLAAGAGEVMKSLLEEIAEADRQDVRVLNSGCLGMCSTEPNVTVEMMDQPAIVYRDMDGNKMRQVFRRHVLLGEVQAHFALARGE